MERLATPVLFERQRYAVLPGLLAPGPCSFFYQVALAKAAAGVMSLDDHQVEGTPSAYSEPLMQKLLEDLLPAIERASGRPLYPTYSYFRVYKHGDVLQRHTDRPACEISVSLSLGFAAPEPWKLWIEGPDGKSGVALSPGDGVLYRGMELPHWRDAFDGDHAAQVFLHYVDSQGENAEWKFDKRPGLYRAVPAGRGRS